MKHLIAILAVFLLLGSQTSAQETIPAPEYLETLPEFTLLNKPVVCGPTKAILDKIAEFMKPRPLHGLMQNEVILLCSI